MAFQLFTYLYSCFICFICILIHLCEHFNVPGNCAFLIKYYYGYNYTIIIIGIIYAQFVNNCLQSYNALCVCGNLMCNTDSIGNKYFS